MNAAFWRPYRFWQGRLPQGEWWGVALYMKVYDVQTFSLRNWEKNIAIRAKRMYSIQFYLWQWGTHFSATYRSEMCSTKSVKTFEYTFFRKQIWNVQFTVEYLQLENDNLTSDRSETWKHTPMPITWMWPKSLKRRFLAASRIVREQCSTSASLIAWIITLTYSW